MRTALDADIERLLDEFERDEGVITRFSDYALRNLRVRPEAVKELMTRAREVAERRKYVDARAWTLYWLGWLGYDRSEYGAAVSLLDEAMIAFEEQRDRNGTMRVLDAIAACYLAVGKSENAIEWADRALSAAEELGNTAMIAAINCLLSDAAWESGAYEDAERYCLRALELDPSEQTQASANIGLALSRIARKDFSGALPLAKVAIRLAENMGSNVYLAESKATMGVALHGVGLDDDAEEQLRAACSLAESTGDRRSLAECLERLASFVLDSGRATEAASLLERAAKIASDTGNRASEGRVRRALSRCHEALGDCGEALAELKRAENAERELRSSDVERVLSRKRAERDRREAAAVKRLYDQTAEIARIGQEITSTLDLDLMLSTVYERVNRLMDASIFGICVADRVADEIEYMLFIDKGIRMEPVRTRIDDPDSMAAWCVRNGAEIFVDDIALEYYRYVGKPVRINGTKEPVRSVIYCPLKTRGKPVGVLTVQSYRRNAYSRHDLDTLRALAGYVAIAIENSRLFAEVNRMATFDSLTGLLNRRRLMASGAKEFYESRRYETPLSLLMLDIDHFKSVNDEFGHDAGDKVLAAVADTIREHVRLSDTAGRYGGEEFLVILPSTDEAGATILAERIRQAVESRRLSLGDDPDARVTVSIGVREFRAVDTGFESGVTGADEALYRAKAGGRNRVERAGNA